MSVMKKILTFFMLLLILCACETRLTDNTDQDIFDFPKYRDGVININTHNYMPSMAKEKIGVTNERSSDSEILLRVTEVCGAASRHVRIRLRKRQLRQADVCHLSRSI